MNIFFPFDVIALAALAWCAFANLHCDDEVRDWRDVALTVALIALTVSSFSGMVYVTVERVPLTWWMRGIIWSASIVAAWAYDYRFGILRHLRLAIDGVRSSIHGSKAGDRA